MAKKNLPDDVILEILLRLPVKSLLRFRSVSKLWNSLISDPQFRKSHFDLAAAQTDRILYIDKSEVRSIDFEASFYEDSSSVKLNFPLIFRHFWGSCRGFLLFYDGSDFVVLNPSTGVCKRISYPPISVSNTGIGLRYSWLDFKVASFLHGFGYNPLKDDYLIVLGCFKLNANIAVIRFMIFSFKTNSWKEIEGTHFPNMGVEDGRGGILLNGALHWIASYYDRLAKAIVGFDLIEESSRELPMPNDFNHSLEFCGLEVLGGCLALHTTGDDTVKIVEIWIMKEYGVKSSWTKSVVVSLDEIDSCYFSPICFTKGGDIVGEYVSELDIKDDSSGLVKYNCKGELLEHRNYCHDMRGFQVAVYTESLLSLPIDGREGGH